MSAPAPPERPGADGKPPEGRVSWARTRLPFETGGPTPFQQAAKRGGLLLYAVLTAGFAGAALYMGFVLRHPLTSAYVMAPAVGAAWFAVRLMMQLRPRL